MNYYMQDETYRLRGCLLEVHKNLGPGFLERVYQEALEQEFISSGVPYEREKQIQIRYKGKLLSQNYVADFLCYGKIIIELKAVSEITDIHKAQVINYLKAAGLDLALVVNFGELSLKVERIFNYKKNSISQVNARPSYSIDQLFDIKRNSTVHGGWAPATPFTKVEGVAKDCTGVHVTMREFADENTGELKPVVSLCFHLKEGGVIYKRVDRDSQLSIGDSVDMNSIVSRKLKKGTQTIERYDGVALDDDDE